MANEKQDASLPAEYSDEKKSTVREVKLPEQSEHLRLTVSVSPHLHHADSTAVIMGDILIALIPVMIWAVYIFGWRALTVTAVSAGFCVLFELWYELIFRKPVTIGDLSAVVTGVLLAFCLPASCPLWLPVAGAFFAIVVVKHLIGSFGKIAFNPVAGGYLFLFCIQHKAVTAACAPFTRYSPVALSVDAAASASPLEALKSGQLPDASLFDLIIGDCSGTIGEVSSLLLLAGGCYLLFRHVISWHIPVGFIGVTALFSYLFPAYPVSSKFMLYEIFSGGLILGAVFLATDYASSPVTDRGRLLFGIGCGLITVLLRFYAPVVEGVPFAILLMNLPVRYIDRYTRPAPFGGRIASDAARAEGKAEQTDENAAQDDSSAGTPNGQKQSDEEQSPASVQTGGESVSEIVRNGDETGG